MGPHTPHLAHGKLCGLLKRDLGDEDVSRVGALRPMFDALPKDSSGRLGFDGVRYVLHRLFVQRHGWFVNGLDTAGDAWNSSSPTGIFKQHADDNVHGLFEEKLTSSGFDLHHTAVLAATFECLVHADCVERLHTAYRMLGFSVMYVQGMKHSTVCSEGVIEYGFTITAKISRLLFHRRRPNDLLLVFCCIDPPP